MIENNKPHTCRSCHVNYPNRHNYFYISCRNPVTYRGICKACYNRKSYDSYCPARRRFASAKQAYKRAFGDAPVAYPLTGSRGDDISFRIEQDESGFPVVKVIPLALSRYYKSSAAITPDEAVYIKKLLRTGIKQRRVAEFFNVTKHVVQRLSKGSYS